MIITLWQLKDRGDGPKPQHTVNIAVFAVMLIACSHLLRASALGGKWVKYLNWMKRATTTTTTMEVMVEGESPGDRCSLVNDNREVIRFQRCRRSVPLGQLITSHQRTTAEL